jgi:hypothetical protein
MKAQNGAEVQLYPSLTSAVDGGRWSTPRLTCFIPGNKTQCPLYRRLGGPQGLSEHIQKTSQPPPPGGGV